MTCLTPFLNKSATIYTIDKSESTVSGQPIETLSVRTTFNVYFSPHVRNVWKLFTPGQIQVGEFVAYSIKSVSTGEIMEIEGTKYLVESSNAMQVHCGSHVFGYQIYLSRYKH